MTDTTLDRQGGGIPDPEWNDSHWVKRSVAVVSCLLLFAALAFVFTRVVAVRVPEQRATLEKLITDRTGFQVRFENVHFAWGLDGTSAVFTRVQLLDPKQGRVRVVAPELRVELDTWDFVRHSQFSFGHVTLKSPDIEIIAEPDEPVVRAIAPRARTAPAADETEDESTLLRRHLAWAEAMPIGRIEVEGARVHLLYRGEKVPRHSFTLSQAVVHRGSRTFTAWGTLLLAQDVGQSLFVSTKLEGLGSGKASGDLRFIARRVFLQKLDLPGIAGRATVDAKLVLRDGRVESATWQASARELALESGGRRFDHVSVNGKLARRADDVLVDLTDLQLSRGTRLERAPALNARLAFEPRGLKVAGGSVRADKLPFMAGEFVAGVLAPHLDPSMPALSEDWKPTAGELQSVRFEFADGWSLDARIADLELARASDAARLSGLTARMHLDAREFSLQFDGSAAAQLRRGAESTRELVLGGRVAGIPTAQGAWRFDEFSVASGQGRVVARGEWNTAVPNGKLTLALHAVDRALLDDALDVLPASVERPETFANLADVTITEGSLELSPLAEGGVDWSRARGKLALAGLATAGEELPRIASGQGSLQFARGGTSLVLEGGNLEDLTIRRARIDWPRRGQPRLQAALEGALTAAVLGPMLEEQGIVGLSGHVALDVDARGEQELREPQAWRVSARVSEGRLPLGADLPAVEGVQGNLRYTARRLRAASLKGEWLGGPVSLELRRAASRDAAPGFDVGGVADAAPLLALLGQERVSREVSGRFAWSGSIQPAEGPGNWRVNLTGNLYGIESRLPAPFAKNRGRAVPVSAALTVSRDGVRDFDVKSGRASLLGQVQAGTTTAEFRFDGFSGEFTRPAASGRATTVRLTQLDLQRGHEVLAAGVAFLPARGTLDVTVEDSRYAGHSLGPLHASLTRQDNALEFNFESPTVAVHQLSGRGRCDADRCRADFTADSSQLMALLRDARLPPEWPTARLHAAGSLEWPVDATPRDFVRVVSGTFELRTANTEHQMAARAALADGEILLSDVQGTGPEADQVFRGEGRVSLLARNYDLAVDYERVALAATAMPSPARARLARAWSAMRGAEPAETRRVQWHGSWD